MVLPQRCGSGLGIVLRPPGARPMPHQKRRPEGHLGQRKGGPKTRIVIIRRIYQTRLWNALFAFPFPPYTARASKSARGASI